MLKRLFAPRPAVAAGRALYVAASRQARAPAFYAEAAAPDTPQGRFELLALHVSLLVRRLRGEGAQAAETSQALFDAFARNLDDGLRDLGVGDLSVGKQMRKLGAAFYGRAKAYDAALDAGPDRAALQALLGRTLYADAADAAGAPAVARYIETASAALARQPLDRLLAGEIDFPEPSL